MSIHNLDITVVGHFSIDSILLPSKSGPQVVLGGSVTYVSLAAKCLGSTVSIISKVGADFPEAYSRWLQEKGIDLSGVTKITNECTTHFELQYNESLSSRTLKLINKAPPITLNDIPLFHNAKVVHLAPIAGEISYDVALHLRKGAEILSIDPQGLLRSFSEAGNVSYTAPAEKRLLSLVDIYKSSQDEISALTGRSDIHSAVKAVHDLGVGIVIVTLGANGSMLSTGKLIHKIPACNSREVIDPTGAGDVFMGGFLTEYVRQKDPLWCACVGSAAASLVVEGVGSTFFGEKEEIYRRANSIYATQVR